MANEVLSSMIISCSIIKEGKLSEDRINLASYSDSENMYDVITLDRPLKFEYPADKIKCRLYYPVSCK